MSFKQSERVKHNAKINKLLNNGERFALIDSDDEIVKSHRFISHLEPFKKAMRNHRIVELSSLLID